MECAAVWAVYPKRLDRVELVGDVPYRLPNVGMIVFAKTWMCLTTRLICSGCNNTVWTFVIIVHCQIV